MSFQDSRAASRFGELGLSRATAVVSFNLRTVVFWKLRTLRLVSFSGYVKLNVKHPRGNVIKLEIEASARKRRERACRHRFSENSCLRHMYRERPIFGTFFYLNSFCIIARILISFLVSRSTKACYEIGKIPGSCRVIKREYKFVRTNETLNRTKYKMFRHKERLTLIPLLIL